MLTRIPTQGMSKPEWLELRRTSGIGGSDIGSVIGLNDWKPSAQLFYEKVGLMSDEIADNEAMFWGRQHEPSLLDKWEYWEHGIGNEKKYIENYNNGDVQRTAIIEPEIAINDKYNFIYGNRDASFLNKDGEECIVEAKTISGWVSDKWEFGIPPYYVAQLQQYMLVYEAPEGEIAILKDSSEYWVLSMKPSNKIQDAILKLGERFWTNVLKGREVYAQMKSDMDKVDPLTAATLSRQGHEEIDSLMPPPDGTIAYEEFLSEKWKNAKIETVLNARAEDYEAVIQMKEDTLTRKDLEANIRRNKSRLMMHMKDATVLDFRSAGKITWRENVNGNRVFNWQALKIDRAQEEYQKLKSKEK